MAQNNLIQLKNNREFLNIYNASPDDGGFACQGTTPTTANFLWQIIPQAGPYFLLQVQNNNAGKCLCIQNGVPVQATLPTPVPDNFLWQINPVAGNGINYCTIQIKNGQYLGIPNPGSGNGAPAGLGNTPTADNFLWSIEPVAFIGVSGGVGSANPETVSVSPGDVVVWTLLPGSHWPAAAASAITGLNFITNLSFVSNTGNNEVQGLIGSNAVPSSTPYSYYANAQQNGTAADEVVKVKFINEAGISFDPKIMVKQHK